MAEYTLDSLAAQLRAAGSEAVTREVEAVVKRGAVNIKTGWRKNARATSGAHARRYPASITFDGPERRGHTITAVIGPDKDLPQGALGVLLEYGSPGQNTSPTNDGKRAAEAEHDRFADEVLKTAAGHLW